MKRACWSCGTATESDRVRILPDVLREGEELIYGECEECHGTKALDREILLRLFDIEPDDPVVNAIPVERFSDSPARKPDKPVEPWSFLSQDDILKKVAIFRQENGPLKGGPCSWCGVQYTPAKTKWRNERMNGTHFATCGLCQNRFQGQNMRSEDSRSYAAAVLCGFERNGSVSIPRQLGKQVSLVWWYETGKRRGNRQPFAHLKVKEMRETVEELAGKRAFRLPAKWDRERAVKW